MDKKRFVVNLLSNIVSYSTTIIISFFLTPYLVQTLGKEAYGFYPLANNFVSYMSIFTAALNSMASRFITIEITKGNIYKANTYFSSVFFSNIILSIILLIPMTIIIIFLDNFLDIPLELVYSIKLLFTFVFISMLINIVTSVFSVSTFAKNRIDLRSGSELFQGILRLVLFVLLFSLFTPNISYVGLVAVILSLSNLIIQYNFSGRLLPEMNLSKKHYDFKSLLEILVSGVWNSINNLGSILLLELSLLICNMFLGASATGVYAIVQTIPNFINGIIGMLTGVFVPSITYVYAKDNKRELLKMVKISQKLIGLVINVPILLIIVFGREFFSLWVPNENSLQLQILSVIILIPIIISSNMSPIFNLNMVMNQVKVPSLVVLGSGVLNIVLVFILLKTTNLELIAIPLSTSILSIIRHLTFVPIYPCIKLEIKKTTFFPQIIRVIISSSIIGVGFYIVKSAFIIQTWSKLILVYIICGVLGMIINTFFTFNISEIKEILKVGRLRLMNRIISK